MNTFHAIQQTVYDVVIIGGGINGVGTARDAALRGLKTLLIEQGDFASGTTSWSTRLIHGGLRYLEYFEINLVRESLRERERLLSAAPHLVKPIQMTIPIYRGGARRYWEIQAGMWLYDMLSFDKTLLSHRMVSVTAMQRHFRSLNHTGLLGAAQYYDGQVEYAERLCLENVRAAADAGATMLNYVAVTVLHCEGDRIVRLTCQDQRTGQQATVAIAPHTIIINTTGPWVDHVCQRVQSASSQKAATAGAKSGLSQPERSASRITVGDRRKIGGTKGSHIIVPPFPGAPDTAVYAEAQADGRPFFIVPWLGLYLIGTTDLRYDGDLTRIKASDSEIDYLLAEANHLFPWAYLSRSQVQFTYSGVRPLPYTDARTTGSITRSHIIFDHTSEGVTNLISLIGGKLTTYRQVAEELVDRVGRKLGRTLPPSPTRSLPLPGAIHSDDSRITEAIARYAPLVSRATLAHLFQMYGAMALDVLALIDQAPDLATPILPQGPDIQAQVVYAMQSEFAQTLVDICHRRTTLSMHHRYGFEALPGVISTLQRHCGWSADRRDQSVSSYAAYMRDHCIPDYEIALGQDALLMAPLSRAE